MLSLPKKRLGAISNNSNMLMYPGILVDGKLWISTSFRSWLDELQEAIVNKMLHPISTDNSSTPSWTFSSALPTHPEVDSEDEDASLGIDAGDQWVPLPNGSVLSVAELTRRLLKHHDKDPVVFSGKRAMFVYKRHFDVRNDKAAIAFGNALIEHGILVVVERGASDRRRMSPSTFASFDLQLQATRALNTFLPPSFLTTTRRWKSVVQDLCTTMENIFSESDASERLDLIEKLTVDSSVLQITSFQLEDENSDTESLLQLYNLMVHHFSLRHELSTSLPDFLIAQDRYGYILQGQLLRASELRNWLWSKSISTQLPPIACRQPKSRRHGAPWLLGRAKQKEDYSFTAPVVTASLHAIPLLLAMVWPSVNRVPYPVPLSPDASARVVCQEYVVQDDLTLWLPTVVAWFRKDFGESKRDLLHNLAPYSETVRTILAMKHGVELRFGVPPRNRKAVFRTVAPSSVDRAAPKPVEDSVYFDREDLLRQALECGNVPSDHELADDEEVEVVPPRFPGGRQPSCGDMSPTLPPRRNRPTPLKKLSEEFDHTETTVTEESASEDSYADWYNYDNISSLTFESSRDLLINEAYLSNGNVPASTRSLFRYS